MKRSLLLWVMCKNSCPILFSVQFSVLCSIFSLWIWYDLFVRLVANHLQKQTVHPSSFQGTLPQAVNLNKSQCLLFFLYSTTAESKDAVGFLNKTGQGMLACHCKFASLVYHHFILQHTPPLPSRSFHVCVCVCAGGWADHHRSLFLSLACCSLSTHFNSTRLSY